MPDFKSIGKDGWHPSWDNKVSINRKNYKDPRAWRKTEDKDAADRARNHQSAPIETLRDPSSFAPPPKNVNYYNPEADAARQQARLTAGGSSSALVPARQPPKDTRHYDTATGGLGGAISMHTLQSQGRAEQLAEEEAAKPKPPPTPYRANTTGLKTDHLPPPPLRRGTPTDSSMASPPPLLPQRTQTPSGPAAAAKPRPPPRLPQRQNSNPNEFTPPPPPTYQQATTLAPPASRLASAGVSVPALGIGRNDQVSELQSRFSGLRTSSSPSPAPAQQQQQRQETPLSFSRASSAFRTAQQAHKDPSSISLAQAKDAASTAAQVNRQYGAQIGQAAGAYAKYAGANSGQDSGTSGYGAQAAGAYAKYASNNRQESGTVGGTSGGGFGALAAAAQAKKKPAPPPPRTAGDAPPPVPTSSKPRF